jgi:hypothetical protein
MNGTIQIVALKITLWEVEPGSEILLQISSGHKYKYINAEHIQSGKKEDTVRSTYFLRTKHIKSYVQI